MTAKDKSIAEPTPEEDAPTPDTSEELWEICGSLAAERDILSRVAEAVEASGFAGSTANVVLIYLAIVTRLFPRPVSVAMLGASSAGKSYTIKQALSFHPPEAYFAVTAMSDKAMIYMDVSLEHRMLVVYEAKGLSGDFFTYGIRTLLSEGRLDYWYTEVEGGKRGVQIVKEGPTGLITSTAGSLDRELSTRMMQPNVQDDSELTKAILLSAANEDEPQFDFAPFHALQRWIATGPCLVTVPFARRLAEETDPSAVRLRRDFPAILKSDPGERTPPSALPGSGRSGQDRRGARRLRSGTRSGRGDGRGRSREDGPGDCARDRGGRQGSVVQTRSRRRAGNVGAARQAPRHQPLICVAKGQPRTRTRIPQGHQRGRPRHAEAPRDRRPDAGRRERPPHARCPRVGTRTCARPSRMIFSGVPMMVDTDRPASAWAIDLTPIGGPRFVVMRLDAADARAALVRHLVDIGAIANTIEAERVIARASVESVAVVW